MQDLPPFLLVDFILILTGSLKDGYDRELV